MTAITPYGFDFGHQRVTRMFSDQSGVTLIRVLNMVTGQYVDVQTSAKGRKNYVNVGTLDKDALKRELEQPE